MRYTEVDNGRVRFVLPPELSPDYQVLPPNAVEIALDADVHEGDVYEDGVFRRVTEDELKALARPDFDSKRKRLFSETVWVRERFRDYKDRYELGDLTDQVWTTVKNRYKLWLIYFQALRDMPAQPDFDPRNPQWPVLPE